MVSPDEIDDQLEPEVKDEMKKYGQVNKVVIFRVCFCSKEKGRPPAVFEAEQMVKCAKFFVELWQCCNYSRQFIHTCFQLLQASDDEAVRIFIEFTNVGQAIKAFVDLNGRFFGGRSIKASFYDLEAYNANQFGR
ncbi:unnamed protein product [Brugia timori]|uniref:RRM domain-containing protein n=1 Tax=Brugia timori TaxID=42155 RepID=A0A0R3QDN2_9BILA|nr:unnamed protein product [Brugia timori]